MDEPVFPLWGEEIGDLEPSVVGPAVARGHEDQLCAEADAEVGGQGRHRGRADRAVHLVAPHHADLGHTLGMPLGQEDSHQVGQAGHDPTISTIWRSRVSSGVGSVTPRTRRAAMQAASGIRDQWLPSPTGTSAVGAPESIWFRWPIIETKATVIRANTRPINHGRPTAKPARTSANSERKRPNGGRPITASSPVANRPPVHGIALSNPDTRPISVVPYRCSTRPARKNTVDFARVWLSRWSIAAKVPSGPRARPTQIRPVCSMLEYASMRL